MTVLDKDEALKEMTKLYAYIMARAEKLMELEKSKGAFPMAEVREHLALAVGLLDKIRVGSGLWESPQEHMHKSEELKERLFSEWLNKPKEESRS